MCAGNPDIQLRGKEKRIMDKTFVRELAVAFESRGNANKAGNFLWRDKWDDRIEKLLDTLPSGSGIDSGVIFDHDASTPDKLVFTFGYHHMNEHGSYTKWTEHKITVTPSLASGFDIKMTKGGASDEDMEYFYDVFHEAFSRNVEMVF